jgi:carboxylate-amine ligase
VAASWRIAENRWSACRYGLDGTMADLVTGALVPTRECAAVLLDDVAAAGDRLRCGAELAAASAGLAANGADRQRAAAAQRGGPPGVAAWLVDRFLG